ncbi:leucine zipper protein 1 [Corythoichthys intestinalis]|uniref:leucine zipper protein 1 n=1 Tax=Corythoichthys intestinalis TaxID=161448 RepID=UPI0025A68E01|nr:leucine zipper protein 1 [Corythoichthys intestinalis]XP_057716208.1 leucine zipper protein 1 [Corythoichthys intestinalis]XP_057716209.1 leucine zipper protein 1 [Corythoichthys intestinalis]
MSDMTHRHLRHKLQSLSRRLDELEEATNKLQKSEDELLDIQDKIIQAEGSNSSLLADVEALRKRLLKIQGKDEEVRKAEDLCRTVREKLEEEENLTMELKAEIEHLQRRMSELEKLEEAFGKSKSDCSQLCLSLNEEKNLTRKLSTELEALKARLKEMEGSEGKLDKAEQALAADLEKLKGFCQTFENEHKRVREKQREDEKIILKLTEKLERLGMSVDPGRADFMRSRIEEELSSTGIHTGNLAGRKKGLDYNFGLLNKSENQKNSGLAGSPEEDNKVKELTQEVERLKNRLKQLEIVEDDLKKSESKNGELHEKFQMERNRTRQLSEQVEQLKTQLCSKGGIGGNGSSSVDKQGNGSANICPNSPAKHLENGKAENEEIVKGGFRQEKPKFRSAASVTEPSSPKHRIRDLSPQHKRENKLRMKEFSNSEESSATSVKRTVSPAHRSRRIPKTPNTLVSSDNGIKETSRGTEERAYKGATYSPLNTPSSEFKKVSVLSRYPPAANDQKPLRTTHRQSDGETKKSTVGKISKIYGGSDSESNNSDVVPDSNTTGPEKDTELTSDQESIDPSQDSMSVTSSLSKANGSYKAYRSNVNQLLPNDQGSEGHSSASETESTGSRPSEPETVNEMTTTTQSSWTATSRYSRYSHIKDSHSEGSSSRSSFDEELHNRGTGNTSSGLEVQRVLSPREARTSKAVIKPAIIEIDKKEMMISEPLSANGKPRISTKPILTNTNKMTSSITFYPNDASSSRTSSRSSSVSSEPLSTKERHTSTSNFLISPSSEHLGSVSIPYEISIPKSDITKRPSHDQDYGADNHNDYSSKSRLHSTSRVEKATRHTGYQRSNLSHKSPDTNSADHNDMDSAFERSTSPTTYTSWQNQNHRQHSQEEHLPDTKNVTMRSTWKNKSVASDEKSRRRAGVRGITDRGSEDELETSKTWKAYLATTVVSEESQSHGLRTDGIVSAARGAKPTSDDIYMRAIDKEPEESVLHRGGTAKSVSLEAGALGRTVPHAPVTSQSWNRAYSQRSQVSNTENVSWKQQSSATNSVPLESTYERTAKTTGVSSKGELWSSRGQTSGKSGAGSRVWTHRQAQHH